MHGFRFCLLPAWQPSQQANFGRYLATLFLLFVQEVVEPRSPSPGRN